MRHKRRGRILGRSPSHRRAMLKNLASSLFLTEREAEFDDNAPEVKGRIVTTLQKAKEVRPLVEKCITIARRSLKHTEDASQYVTDADRNTDEWRNWRKSSQWRDWSNAIAPAVAARRRALQLLGDKEAVRILFDEVAPRFADRDGGYTRIMRLAQVRLGDGGTRAILEFVGVRDRVVARSEKPSFDDELEESPAAESSDDGQTAADETAEQPVSDDSPPQADAGASEGEEKTES